MATLASTERSPMVQRQAPRLLRAHGLHAPEHLFLLLTRVLKRPIVCSESVKSKSNSGSPDNLSNFGAPGKLASNFGTP